MASHHYTRQKNHEFHTITCIHNLARVNCWTHALISSRNRLQHLLKTSGNLWFSDVSQEYRKRPMKWVKDTFNKYICQQNVDIHACSITDTEYDLHWSIIKRYKILALSDLSWFCCHLSVTTSSKCSWQPIKTINCLYHCINFKA